jgi:hypothetical protein
MYPTASSIWPELALAVRTVAPANRNSVDLISPVWFVPQAPLTP